MADFPKLKTGAVAQYPAAGSMQFSTRVLRFADGGEQRWARFASPVRSWIIVLAKLDEAELTALSAFYLGHKGRFANFTFEDPWSGTIHSNCSFEHDELTLTMTGELNAGMTLAIRRNRS